MDVVVSIPASFNATLLADTDIPFPAITPSVTVPGPVDDTDKADPALILVTA